MLTVTGLLLSWSALGMVFSPRMLVGRAWTARWPRLALATWCFTLLTGVLCVLVSLALVLRLESRYADLPRRTSLGGSLAVRAILTSVEGCVLTALVGGLIGVCAWRALPLVRHHVETRRLLRGPGRQLPVGMCDGVPVVELECREPMARSVAGRRPTILISSGLRRILDADEVDAVIAHERAHLSQHHAAIALLAALQRSCAPALPCSRAFERSVLVLLELAADDAAARQHGTSVTASAIEKVARAESDVAAHLRSCRLVGAVPASDPL